MNVCEELRQKRPKRTNRPVARLSTHRQSLWTTVGHQQLESRPT